MKITTVMIALALGASTFTAIDAAAQQSSNDRLNEQLDSSANAKNSEIEMQKKSDAQTLSDLKHDRSDTKLEAKEAQRVETNASNSAKASKNAYKSEKKAQKARRHANSNAKKAEQAKRKND